MTSLCRSHARHAASVQLDRIFMISNVAVLRAAEINSSLSLFHLVQRTHVPISVCDLLDEFAVRAIMKEMSPAAAIAEPEKRSIFQPAQAVIYSFDPGFGLFAKHCGGLSVVRVGGIQIKES